MLAGLDSGDATALNDGVAGAEGDKNGGVQGGAGDMPLPPGWPTAADADLSVAADVLASSCRRQISFTLIVFSEPAETNTITCTTIIIILILNDKAYSSS